MKFWVIFSASIILHEISHVLAIIICGYKIESFKLVPIGSSIKLKENIKEDNFKNIFIYLAGPLSNFVVCFFTYKFNIIYREEIFYTNLVLGIFNMFPINQLDGGKIIFEVLKNFDLKKAKFLSYNISKYFLVVITFLYACFLIKIKNIYILVLLMYLWYLQYLENKKIKLIKKVYYIIEKSKI